MSNIEIEIQPVDLLTGIHNTLKQRFFDATRNDAKKLYRDIESGREVPLMEIGVEGKGEVACNLTLDHSQFVGKLNFSYFLKILDSHQQHIASKLSNKEDLNIFTSDSRGMIFHIPGIVDSGDKPNILVTGTHQEKPGTMTIRLMFLDSTHFKIRPGNGQN